MLLGLTLVSSVILARILGPEGRGLFALVLLLPELARSLALLGFEQANAVYAGLEPRGCRVLVWQSVAVAGVVGGGITVAGVCFIAFGAPGFHALVQGPLWLYLLALLMVPGMLVVDYWYAIIRGMNRIALLNSVEVGSKAAALISVVVVVGLLQLGVTGAVWADAAMKIGTVVLMVVLLEHVGVWGKPSSDRHLWKRTSRFALLAYGGTIAAYLNYRIDEFIIASFLPPEQLGFYVIAFGLAERLWILTGAVANVLLPHLTNSQERDPTLPAVIARHVTLWTGIACLGIFILADTIVQLLFSSAFAAAAPALRCLLPGIFVLSVGKVLVAELHAREKVHYTVWASGIAACLNIVLNVFLLARFGISGVALASSISYSFLSCMVTWYYLWETGVHWTVLLPCRNDLLVYTTLWHHVRVYFFPTVPRVQIQTAANKESR